MKNKTLIKFFAICMTLVAVFFACSDPNPTVLDDDQLSPSDISVLQLILQIQNDETCGDTQEDYCFVSEAYMCKNGIVKQSIEDAKKLNLILIPKQIKNPIKVRAKLIEKRSAIDCLSHKGCALPILQGPHGL